MDVGDIFNLKLVYCENLDKIAAFEKRKTSTSAIMMGNRFFVMNGDKDISLASSTPSSTKKFKITVDDTGTISATEVTE